MDSTAGFRHIIEYRYDKPVRLGIHNLRLTPQSVGHAGSTSNPLIVTPNPAALTYTRDLFDNQLARLRFSEPLSEWTITNDVIVGPPKDDLEKFPLAESAIHLPFRYVRENRRDLQLWLRAQPPGPGMLGILSELTELFAPTLPALAEIVREVAQSASWNGKTDAVLRPLEDVLKSGSGNALEVAWLLAQVLRHGGMASRLAAGYLVDPNDVSKTSLVHWSEVYLPGAGWKGLDGARQRLCDSNYIATVHGPTPQWCRLIEGVIEPCDATVSSRFEAVTAQHLIDNQLIPSIGATIGAEADNSGSIDASEQQKRTGQAIDQKLAAHDIMVASAMETASLFDPNDAVDYSGLEDSGWQFERFNGSMRIAAPKARDTQQLSQHLKALTTYYDQEQASPSTTTESFADQHAITATQSRELLAALALEYARHPSLTRLFGGRSRPFGVREIRDRLFSEAASSSFEMTRPAFVRHQLTEPDSLFAHTLLVRALIAKNVGNERLIWQAVSEKDLNDQFRLPSAIWRDFLLLTDRLAQSGLPIDPRWFENLLDQRFPILAQEQVGDVQVVVRRAYQALDSDRIADTSGGPLYEFSVLGDSHNRFDLSFDGWRLPLEAFGQQRAAGVMPLHAEATSIIQLNDRFSNAARRYWRFRYNNKSQSFGLTQVSSAEAAQESQPVRATPYNQNLSHILDVALVDLLAS